jgi:hypothetical protein
MVKDRKAWIRILEAFIAIMIIMGSLIVIISKQPKSAGISDEIYSKQRQILDTVSKNTSLRSEVLSGDINSILLNQAINELSPASWNYSINICNLSQICTNPANNADYMSKDVYATEMVISSDLITYNPKKLRFFVWVK